MVLRRKSVPPWLYAVDKPSDTRRPFPLKTILKNSLYYPASEFDGDPVKFFAGNIHSFVYADCGRSEEELLQALANPGFLGYEPIATRSVTAHELKWPELPSYLNETSIDSSFEQFVELGWVKQPFCSWTVFQRCDDRPTSHGPARFSFLYLCADGTAAYQALYVANAVAPKAIVIIQPGWSDFSDPEHVLARTVAANQAGKPELLLYGGYGSRDYFREPCWPEYSEHIRFLDKHGGGTIGVWRLNADERAARAQAG
jgi:hypothetical protein